MKIINRVKSIACAIFGFAFVSFTYAAITPPSVEVTLNPGESVVIEKMVDVPELPPKMDICLLIDVSNSYTDDLPNIKALAPDIFDAVKAEVDDVQFCTATFVDFPFSPWGFELTGDFAYMLDQNLTPDRTTWLDSINALTTFQGVDFPESQYEALFQMATGQGRDVPPPGDSLGDIPPGLDVTFREDATKVIVITTDAPFHNPGDPGPFPYPGPSRDDTVNALNADGITVIALKAPGASLQMDDIAEATGGVVETTDSTSSDIADAILSALEQLEFTVKGESVGCEPLEVTLDPESIVTSGGETLTFQETIFLPDVPSPDMIQCEVQFFADEALLGVQEIKVNVETKKDCPKDDSSDSSSSSSSSSSDSSGKGHKRNGGSSSDSSGGYSSGSSSASGPKDPHCPPDDSSSSDSSDHKDESSDSSGGKGDKSDSSGVKHYKDDDSSDSRRHKFRKMFYHYLRYMYYGY